MYKLKSLFALTVSLFLFFQSFSCYSDQIDNQYYIAEKPIGFEDFLYEYYKSPQYKKNGFSKVLYATAAGYKDIALYLASRGEDLNKLPNGQSYSCLFAAINLSDTSLVRYFLEKGADPKIMLKNQKTLLNRVLELECDIGDELLEMILEYGVLPDGYGLYDNGKKPLMTAAQFGRKKAFFTLIEHGAQAVSNGNNMYLTDNLLLEACKGGGPEVNQDRFDIVKYLVDVGANVNYKSNTIKMSPLHLSAQGGFSDVFIYLISKKARLQDPYLIYKNGVFKQGVFKQTVLGSVISGKYKGNERIKVIDFLIKNKTNLNTKTYIKFAKNSEGVCPPIFKALYENKEGIFKHLLALGAAVNAYCECEESNPYNGFTPLMLAIEREDITLVETLLGHGANPEYKGNISTTPLDFAFSRGNEEIIAILIASMNRKYD